MNDGATALTHISIHDRSAIDQLAREQRVDRHRIRLFRNAFFKKQQSFKDALREIPSPSRDVFRERVLDHKLTLSERRDSRVDGATKLLLLTDEGAELETVVLRIDSGRTSVCVSSQVGCAARCRFCATGQMAGVTSLSRDEILDQVVRANQMVAGEGRHIRNVVFMGMGEPFHNEAAVFESIEALTSPQLFNLSARHVVVSTVGIPDAMIRCAERFPRVHQALSLHSVQPTVREKLMPIAKRYDLDTLRRTIREVGRRQETTVMVEYILLDGWNASMTDAQDLAEFLHKLPVHINVIPFNAVPGSPFRSPDREHREAFAQYLRSRGFPVTLRYSLGGDIAAACGQLVQESRIKAQT